MAFIEPFDWKGYHLRVTHRANAVKLILRHREGETSFDVTLPPGCTRRELTAFLEQNKGWMDRELQKAASLKPPTGAAGEKALLLGDTVLLGQNGIPAGRAFLRLRAESLVQLIEQLLPVWQRRMGVTASRISFRSMRTRWGSCQPQTRCINLSSKLGSVPPECVEYVLVHELCHLLHPDHSPRFHAAMTCFLPDWQRRRDRLKAFGRLIDAFEAGQITLDGGTP